jgi:hypothetical protein
MRRLAAIPIAALGLGLLGAGSAGAKAVTVGSPLAGTFTEQGFSGPLTLLNRTLAEPGAWATSPLTGTIVRWRLRDPLGGPFRLRVLTPVAGKTYTGAGSGPFQAASGAGIHVLPVSLPIAAGQTIAIDNSQGGDKLGGRSVSGSSYLFMLPQLADGATATAIGPANGLEVGFNADVATDALGRAKRNRRRGTAKLTVRLPGPGKVTLRGKALRRDRAERSGAGRVKLLVKPKGRLRHRLRRTGSAKVRVRVSFVPTGVPGGAANVQHRTIKLRRNR